MRRAIPPPRRRVHDRRRTAASATCARARPKARSPFVRLHELLADIKPGKPAINLSVGEPQHPIPPFVGPVLQAHLNDFGRYPANKGTERLPQGRRRLARPPLSSCRARRPRNRGASCSTARAKACSSARVAAKRYVAAARRQARDPDSQSVLCRLFGRRRRRRLRAGLSADHARNRLPARSRRDRRRAARAHGRLLPRLAVEPAGRGRRCRLSRRASSAGAALRLPGVRRRVLLRNLSQRPTRRPACWKRRGPISPTSWCSTRCPSARTCRGCASASPPATAASSPATSSCATSPRRRCRCRRRRSPSRPTATRPMSRRTASSTSPKFDLADQIIGDRYGYQRPAGGFFLWLDVSRAGRRRGGRPEAVARGGLRVIPGHYLARDGADGRNPGARLHPRRAGAGQGNHGRGAASPRRRARLRLTA